MERFCTNCGTTLEADAVFCPECGAKVNLVTPVLQNAGAVEEAPEKPVQAPQDPQSAAPAPAPAYEPAPAPAPAYTPASAPAYTPASAPDPAPAAPAPEKPEEPVREDVSKTVKTPAYFWLMLLYAIPVIGLIIMIIMACAARNKSIRNFAKAHLVWLLIGLILLLVSALAAFILSKQMDIDFTQIDFNGIWQAIKDGIGL